MITILLCSFGLVLLAPLLYRIFRQYTGWLFGLLVFGLAFFFLKKATEISNGLVFRDSLEWIPSLGIRFSFYLDGLSLLFVLIVSIVGALVLIYSGAYLAGNRNLNRFYTYLLLFMSSMLGLVLADNVITMFVFWELTSVSSFFLIGFYHERAAAHEAAWQALLVTGSGGLALLLGFLLLARVTGSFELSVMLGNTGLAQQHSQYALILILVLIGAFTKSAQFPFHFWLPAAMEAPAPVSAYLHAATMVKAGIYLLARLSPILGGTDLWYYLISTVGTVTMLAGALLALWQSDFKLILAYSTVSALGTLMLMLGLNNPLAAEAAMVFLVVHTLYKGSLFLIAGAVDHETGTRNINSLGGIKNVMPLTALAAVFAALTMAGIPPTIGFIGKELLYEAKLHAAKMATLFTIGGVVTFMLMVAIAGIVSYRVFFGKVKNLASSIHEAPFSMLLGPLVLSALGLLVGLFPQMTAGSLLSSAVSALTKENTLVKLSIWHGLNPVFLLSLASLTGGVAIYRFRHRLLQTTQQLQFFKIVYPSRLYQVGVNTMLAIARLQTKIIQNGHLRYYLITIFGITSFLAGYKLICHGIIQGTVVYAPLLFYEVGMVVLMLLATLFAVLSPNRMTCIVMLAIIGYGVSLFYIIYSAPDLAMTQFLIETVTLVLFILVTYHLPDFKNMSSRGSRILDAILSLSVGGVMTALIINAGLNQYHPAISRFFVENSLELAHGRNIVNVILVDFRGLDTLGEITVLAVAGIGVYALVKIKNKKQERNE